MQKRAFSSFQSVLAADKTRSITRLIVWLNLRTIEWSR